MESFRSLLRVIGLPDPTKIDFISELPLEISQMILRKLDSQSLRCVEQVSKKWLAVCRSEKKLRSRAKGELSERSSDIEAIKKLQEMLKPKNHKRVNAVVLANIVPFKRGRGKRTAYTSVAPSISKLIRL